MNPVQSLQAFFLAAAALDSARTFYIKGDNKFERLRCVNSTDVSLVTFGDKKFSPMPLFILNNGIATTMEGNQSKVFGLIHRIFVIGGRENVTPFKIELDDKSKVINLQMNFCIAPQSFLPSMTLNSATDTAGMKCSPRNVYFLSPGEVKELQSAHGINGTEANNTTGVNAEIDDIWDFEKIVSTEPKVTLAVSP